MSERTQQKRYLIVVVSLVQCQHELDRRIEVGVSPWIYSSSLIALGWSLFIMALTSSAGETESKVGASANDVGLSNTARRTQ